jgi:uncharacterized protein YutE (UPF0331/DUF86 family)
MNDIIINKIQSIQQCIRRAREEHQADPDAFETNYSRQDAAVMNILRACEQAIDLANHTIKFHKMGIPTSSAASFDLLRQQNVIDDGLTEKLKKMIHFRNTVIHQYQTMDVDIVKTVIYSGLDDLIEFGDRILAFSR